MSTPSRSLTGAGVIYGLLGRVSPRLGYNRPITVVITKLSYCAKLSADIVAKCKFGFCSKVL